MYFLWKDVEYTNHVSDWDIYTFMYIIPIKKIPFPK